MTPLADPIARLDQHFDKPLGEQLDQLPAEPEFWWAAECTYDRELPVWSVAYGRDLLETVDCEAGWPYAVIGEVRIGGYWMQVLEPSPAAASRWSSASMDRTV